MTAANALRQAAFEILEEGLFLFLEEGEPSTEVDPVRFTMAIDGDGKTNAEIGLQAGHEVARSLAANMLGIDPEEVSETDVRAAVAEALNMVAGRILADTVGTAAELELHPPEVGGAPHGDTIVFQAAEGQLTLWYAA